MEPILYFAGRDTIFVVGMYHQINWTAEAEQIGHRLQASARRVRGRDAVLWLKPRQPEGSVRPATLGPHLYAGSSGIALFLASLGYVLGRVEYRSLALAALAPLRQQLAYLVCTPAVADKLRFQLGGLIGLGGFIYCFVRIGRWLEEPNLITEACDIATLITPERIESDVFLDVMYGCAGAALSLLLLDREAPANLREQIKPLRRAIWCGEHLMRRSILVESAGRVARGWPAHIQPLASGFAHGTSGIAHALARLAERSGREDLWQTAQEGWAFNRLCYSTADRDWRSQRDPRPIRISAWCNGAPGIALGRLGISEHSKGSTVGGAETHLALETTRQAAKALRDHVCCGNMGRADILLQAYRTIGDDSFLQDARELAAEIVGCAKERAGVFLWSYHENNCFSPGFFKGAAGIGYSLLRLSCPSLPCVLALE